MLVIPAQPLPNQQLQCQVGNQACTLNIYQSTYGLFMDVYVGGTLIVGGVICEDFNRIVRDLYLGFVGDFVWMDSQGLTDPVYTGIGTRYLLLYLELSDLGGEG